MDGIINVRKDKGYTSFDVVAIVRRAASVAFGAKIKCGHTGTLDPDATGVLPVCLGKATKFADIITDGLKVYTAEVIFGTATDTQDASGCIIGEKETEFTEAEFYAALESFMGEYTQIPPMYSAIKQGGKKLYELARAGKEIERKPRCVTIYDIRVLDMDLPKRAVISVECSKGTYIRTLCADLGERLGGLAHMGNLTRTQSSKFRIEHSTSVERIKQMAQDGTLDKIIIPIETVLNHTRAVASESCEKIMYNGGALRESDVSLTHQPLNGEPIFVFNKENVLVGLYEYAQGVLKPKTMLRNEP